MSQPPTYDPRQGQTLAKKCQAHLNRELQVIQQFVRLSEEIQNSLGQSVFPEVEPLRDAQRGLTDAAKAIGVDRESLRHEISIYLDLSFERATIRKLTEALPAELAAPLVQLRQQIIETHSRISHLNHTNSMLLQQSIDIYQKILYGISGQTPQSQVYSANGHVSSGSSISLVSTDC